MIGAICQGIPFAFGMFECSITSDIFYAWVTQQLISELPTRSVIVMDNATFHKRADIRQALEDAGHIILWLPLYSPDLNPIEKKRGLGLRDYASNGGLSALKHCFFGF